MFKKLFSKSDKKDAMQLFLSKLDEIYKYAPSDFGGGCAYEKALTLAFFIKEFNYCNSADIGVYRGRSLFPQAIAHRDYTKGVVYAIDPYSNDAAVQNDKPEFKEMLDDFAKTTDFNKIFEEVNKVAESFSLIHQCKFIRSKSHDALQYFLENKIKFGLVHIDGNHDTYFVMQDVNDYFPLLENNATIVLDDISWDSVKPAFDFLSQNMTLIGECINETNDFAVFVKTGDHSLVESSKKLFASIIKN